MPKLRILVIGASDRIVGGHSVQAREIVKYFQNSKAFDVRRFHIDSNVPFFIRKIPYLRTVVNEMFFLIGLLPRLLCVDVLHIFSASYWSFLLGPTPAILLGRIFGKRVLLNYHSGEAEDHLSRWSIIVKPILKLVDELVVPSAYLQKIFSRYGIKTKVIPNAVDFGRFQCDRSSDGRPLRMLCTRNFENHYGIPQVMMAFRKIRNQVPGAQLTLVGDGPRLPELRKLARELNLKGVFFVGQVDHSDIPGFYKKANLFLNASTVDNMPLSLIEAMAAGLVVVSTACGGIPFLIKNGVNGILVHEEDANSLANKVIEVYRNPQQWNDLRSQAIEYAQKLTPDIVGKQRERLYGSLCG